MADEKKHIYTKRQQQVRRQLFLIGLGVLLLAGIILFINIKNSKIEQRAKEVAKISETQREKSKQEVNKIKETPEQRLERVRQEAMKKNYPKGVIELLDKNPATVDFVENYEKKKDIPATETLEMELAAGQIPLVLQWDERWGYAPYGTSNVAVSGCGPTCLTMVIAGLTGDASVTPAKVAAYGTANGSLDEENNTYWEFMRTGGNNWGIKAWECEVEETQIVTQLKAGHPVILSVGPGDFTKYGHFIVLTGYEDGKIKVNDPFSTENSEKLWEFSHLKEQAKAAWVYSYGE